MFHTLTLRASDREASQRFYDVVLPALGTEPSDFEVVQADPERPATRGLHIGFVAPSRTHSDAFWRAGPRPV